MCVFLLAGALSSVLDKVERELTVGNAPMIVVGAAVLIALVSWGAAAAISSVPAWMRDTRPVKDESKKRICPSCGHENEMGKLFCVKCGKKFKLTEKKAKRAHKYW